MVLRFLRKLELILVIFACSPFCDPLFATNQDSMQHYEDHGLIDARHIQVAETFIDKNLKKSGKYSSKKIANFIKYLEKEKLSIKHDIYETKILEKLELDIRSHKKAKKDAKEDVEEHKNKVLRGYNEFLIPKMKNLLHLVSQNQSPHLWDGFVDEFIRGYIPYFVPNAYRTPMPRDISIFHTLRHFFYRFKFKKSMNSLEANNLMVKQPNLEDVNKCLKKSIQENDYLSQEDIKNLKTCQYDISKLDPGISSLWQHPTKEKDEDIFNPDPNLFPKKDQKIYLQRVNFRGNMSPKLKVFYYNNGEKIKIKLKMGQEVHTDIATSRIFELLGLNQDKMAYVPNVKIYLNDTSYEKFKSVFINKYGLEKLTTFISGHGGEAGNEWILVKDVLFETRINNEIRVSPVDISSWDLRNRREYRSLLMLYSWIGINNTKPANYKFIYKETQSGLRPLLRLQDVGSSLGGPSYFRKFGDLFSLFQYERVNAFPTTFMKQKNINEIRVDWNDFSAFKRYFDQTSWYDMKWMARKIAALNPDDIHTALLTSGMAMPVADLFRIKLILRRNEMVKMFRLESEYPLIHVPNLKKYNPKNYEHSDAIKNGKLVQKTFAGKNTLTHVQPTWQTMLQQIASFDLPVTKWKENETGHAFRTGLQGLEGLKASIGVSESDAISATTSIPLGVGVEAILTRKVSPNENYMNSHNKFRMYKILDKITFRFGLDSPMLRRAMNKIKFVGANLGIRFYEYKFSHLHYHDDIKEAYKGDFKLKKGIRNLPKFAAFKLNQLEMLREYSKIGFEPEFGLGAYSFKPIINNEIGASFGIRKQMNRYYLRDNFGQLHFFKDQLKDKYSASILNIFETGGIAVKQALLKLNHGRMNFKSKIKDYIFELDQKDRDLAPKLLTKERRLVEYKGLKKLLSHKNIEDDGLVKENFQIKSSGASKFNFSGLLYFLNYQKSSNTSSSKVKIGNKTHKFLRHSVSRTKQIGANQNNGLPQMDITVFQRKKVRIITEIDKKDPKNFVLIIRTQDFFRKRKKQTLERLIHDLNRRYSKSSEEPFYKDYILPDKEVVNDFKKIYALTRIFVDGKKLLKNLDSFSDKDFKNIAKEYFSGHTDWNRYQRSEKISARKRFIVKSKIRSTLHDISKLKHELAKKKSKRSSLSIAKLYDKFVNTLEVETYGLYFLRKIVGPEGLFVMGEISGVLNSYSGLTDLQQLQRRRFAGTSWGVYRISPPIQKFLRYNRPVAPSVHIEKNISDSLIFGYLENSLAPNIEFLFGNETDF